MVVAVACGSGDGQPRGAASPEQLLFTAFGTHEFSCDDPQAGNVCEESPAALYVVPDITAGGGSVPADLTTFSNQPDPLESWTLGGLAANDLGIVAGLQAGSAGRVAYQPSAATVATWVTDFGSPITAVLVPEHGQGR